MAYCSNFDIDTRKCLHTANKTGHCPKVSGPPSMASMRGGNSLTPGDRPPFFYMPDHCDAIKVMGEETGSSYKGIGKVKKK